MLVGEGAFVKNFDDHGSGHGAVEILADFFKIFAYLALHNGVADRAFIELKIADIERFNVAAE